VIAFRLGLLQPQVKDLKVMIVCLQPRAEALRERLGAFAFTEAIPFSMPSAELYISLRPSLSPFAALRLNMCCPPLQGCHRAAMTVPMDREEKKPAEAWTSAG
jgi:hypothetical protein